MAKNTSHRVRTASGHVVRMKLDETDRKRFEKAGAIVEDKKRAPATKSRSTKSDAGSEGADGANS